MKSITFTTFEEKQAATLVSSTFQATSNISPCPLKFLTCFPSRILQMYNWPAKEPLAKYSPDGENETEYTESRCRDRTCIHAPDLMSHNRTDPSNDAVASLNGFGFAGSFPIGLLIFVKRR